MRSRWLWRIFATLTVTISGLDFLLVSHPKVYWQGFLDGVALIVIAVLLWILRVLDKPEAK